MTKISKKELESMLRVDHAGEYGAKIIYEAQMKVIKKGKAYYALKEMYYTECKHLKFFENKLIDHNVSPSKLLPLWNVSGKAFGYITSLLGKEAAMAATVSIEEVIEKHYKKQLEKLKVEKNHKDLFKNISKFLKEEEKHKHIAIKHDGRTFPILSKLTKYGTKLAIFLSERI